MARLKEIKRWVRAGVITLELRFTNERIKLPIDRLRTRNLAAADRLEKRWRAKWVNDLIPSTAVVSCYGSPDGNFLFPLGGL